MRVSLLAFGISSLVFSANPAVASVTKVNGGKAVCTITYKGDEFMAQAPTQAAAEHAAISACMKSGGSKIDCSENVTCVIKGGGETDQGQQDQDQDQNQNGDQEQDQDQQQDQDQTQDYPQDHHQPYYQWGRTPNGYGYCYLFAPNGAVMHYGTPQPNHYCERVQRSHFTWGQSSWDGLIYCYQWTPYGHVMNDGRAVPNRYCGY